VSTLPALTVTMRIVVSARAATNAQSSALDAFIPFSVEVRRRLNARAVPPRSAFQLNGLREWAMSGYCGVCSLDCGICSEAGRPRYWRSVTWRFGTGRSQQPECPEAQRAAHRKHEDVSGVEVSPVDHLEEVGGCDEAEQATGRDEIRLHRVGRPISQ